MHFNVTAPAVLIVACTQASPPLTLRPHSASIRHIPTTHSNYSNINNQLFSTTLPQNRPPLALGADISASSYHANTWQNTNCLPGIPSPSLEGRSEGHAKNSYPRQDCGGAGSLTLWLRLACPSTDEPMQHDTVIICKDERSSRKASIVLIRVTELCAPQSSVHPTAARRLKTWPLGGVSEKASQPFTI
ncbi:hypothetical protein CC79DRAFT_1054309 [Sarocladium strictum]